MRVTFETLSDPGGSIPDFVINWASENYPVTLFEGLSPPVHGVRIKIKN